MAGQWQDMAHYHIYPNRLKELTGRSKENTQTSKSMKSLQYLQT